ncbi:hypothetical protein EVAR_50349_1 [Eumeta japonica]|uniref:Uncharacterized protein n=1 Tax=Eumeta variegata TaxID=151549 RepID=A0A4C1XPA5_EUMVA|nr:hypothetical protein EVAR_50349_1 [Eumeta japonica]
MTSSSSENGDRRPHDNRKESVTSFAFYSDRASGGEFIESGMGVVHPTQLLANRHLVKLGRIKKSERKRCPSLIAATPQEIRRPHREACAREEKQSGVRAYAAIAEVASFHEHALPDRSLIGQSNYARQITLGPEEAARYGVVRRENGKQSGHFRGLHPVFVQPTRWSVFTPRFKNYFVVNRLVATVSSVTGTEDSAL